MEETGEPDDLDGISGDVLDLEDFLEFLITLKGNINMIIFLLFCTL